MLLPYWLDKRDCSHSALFRKNYHHYSKKVFEENLTDTQFSYRDGCSCADALIQIHYNYLKALDDKDFNYVSFLQWIFQKPLIIYNTH